MCSCPNHRNYRLPIIREWRQCTSCGAVNPKEVMSIHTTGGCGGNIVTRRDMKIVSENPPLVIETINCWPNGRWQRILNINWTVAVFEVKLFSLKITVYPLPFVLDFDFEIEVIFFGVGVSIANSE